MVDEPTQTATQPGPSMVPESDLLAVKRGAEKKESELLTQLAEANRVRNETHTNLLQMQAAKEQIEEQLKDGTANKTQVEELQTKLKEAEATVSQLSTKWLDYRRTTISTKLNMNVDDLKDMNDVQLDALEKVPATGKPASVDIAGGGGGTAVPTTALEQCKDEIAAIRSKRGG